MAQLAAQDYFTRLQASGLSAFPHPDLASAFPSALSMGGVNSGGGTTSSQSSSSNNRQSGGETKSKSRKEKKSSNSNSGGTGNNSNNTNSSGVNYNANNSSMGQNSHSGGNSNSISSTMLPTSSPSSYKVCFHHHIVHLLNALLNHILLFSFSISFRLL